jgi:hypothetical protein
MGESATGNWTRTIQPISPCGASQPSSTAGGRSCACGKKQFSESAVGLLQVLGFEPEVCHLNEGHTAFAVLERARSFMDDYQQPFDVALAVTRAGNLFTTHTPVDAGFDRFSLDVMKKYFEWYAKERLRISLNDLLALGRKKPQRRFRAVQHGVSCNSGQRRGERS